MPKPPRNAVGGIVYHVLNRANAGGTLFETSGDYEAFEKIMSEANDRLPTRILAYCLMSTHWHMIVWPSGDGDLSCFMHWLTLTHVRRWHQNHASTGFGHLYQGTFKSFPVQTDGYFLTLCRYVERNPLRAGLVAPAEKWKWGSLWRRQFGDAAQRTLLCPWPVPLPSDWMTYVNAAETDRELQEIRNCVGRSAPLGTASWSEETARRLGIVATLRPRGRPRKGS